MAHMKVNLDRVSTTFEFGADVTVENEATGSSCC